MISKNQLSEVVVRFISDVVAPKAPNGLTKFGIGFMLPYIKTGTDRMIAQYETPAMLLGVMDGNGRIDVEQAYKAACQSLEQVGGKLTVAGYVLDKSDIDAIREIANNIGD